MSEHTPMHPYQHKWGPTSYNGVPCDHCLACGILRNMDRSNDGAVCRAAVKERSEHTPSLKRCPFCGANATKVYLNAVECLTCGAAGPDVGGQQGSPVAEHRAQAIAAWNTRASHAALKAALERLANAADHVGVRFFDTDTMEPEVSEMQQATIAARRALSEA